MRGWGDAEVAAAERVREVMDGNGASSLPYGGRVCDCPHGTGSELCCIEQLELQ